MNPLPSAAGRWLRPMFVAATVILAGGNAAPALEQDRNFVLRHGSMGDLQIHDTRQRRDAFREDQTRFREVDRERAAGQPRRPKIPRLPRNCLPPPIGTNALGSCR